MSYRAATLQSILRRLDVVRGEIDALNHPSSPPLAAAIASVDYATASVRREIDTPERSPGYQPPFLARDAGK